jgi:hypothetical protein
VFSLSIYIPLIITLSKKRITKWKPESSDNIIETWKGFLPGFDKTHHQVSDFKVSQNDSLAQVHLSEKAEHYISNEIWTVEGTYDVNLSRSDAHWKVTAFRFNFTKQNKGN